MLESLVATLLNRFLGSYVENFDPKQLNIGIWSGDVKLKNLRLKKESLDRFKLPLDVKFGHLGQLTLQIPWSNLKSKPVKVLIEDVYLLASPIIITEYDEKEEHDRELTLKKRKLEDLEIINKSKPDAASDVDEAKNLSFTENLVTKIVDNLQVTIKNIHVRYEDSSVFTEDPYSFGFTLAELSAVSTDESWLPTFISGVAAHTNKLLTLNSFEIYWNTELEPIYTEDTTELLENFKELIEKNSKAESDTQYLLKPVSGTGHLTVSKRGATETTPHIKTELFFEEFGIDLDSEQYKGILWTASKFHWYIKTQQFRKLRPKETVEEAPLKWFKYAADCVLSEIHEKNYKWTWDHFKKRRDQRKLYVSLWKTKIVSSVLSAEQQKELDELEDVLPFDDIRFYRSLARKESTAEKLQIKHSATAQAQPAPAKQQEGWLSSWWGGSKSTTTANADSSEEIQMTEEQRKELYEAIEYDEQKALAEAVDIPKDRVKMEVVATLKRGALAIRKSKRHKNTAEVIFEGCRTQFYQRPDSFLACFQLQEFKVEDGTESTLYKHVVSVEQLHSGIHTPGASSDENEAEPFFQVSFENNPLDGSADTALSSKLRSMTIFHNPKFIEDIARFFKPPKMHLDTVGMIMNAAESTLEGLTTQTRIGLQYALEEHKTLNCKLDLQAPLIIIPLDPSDWSSPVAILDAGHISVISDLADPKLIEEVKAADSSTYSAHEWEKLNNLMYDKFDLHLQDAQILIGSNIKSTIEQLHSESEKPALILDNLSIKFLAEVSIMPAAYSLARFKIGGNIPKFRASLNDYQYKVMMQLIDKAIPNFEFEDEEEDNMFVFPTLHHDIEGELEEIPNDNASVVSKTTVSNGKDPSAKNEQHLFEFYFDVDSIQLSLSRCSDTSTFTSEPLVDLCGNNLHLDFYKTALDMGVDLVLSEITMHDHIVSTPDAEFSKLISSNPVRPGSHSPQKNEDLLQLKYKRTQRIVEFNNKEIELFDQDIDVDIASIKIMVTRKSLLTLLNFILNTFTDPNPPETPADELRHNADDEESAPQKINVTLNLESIMMVLNDDGIKLATIQLSKADVNVFVLPEKMKVFAKLGGFTLHDDMNESSPLDSPMRQLISIEGEELAELTYETFDRANNPNNYTSLVKFHAGSLRINFIEAPFTQIFGFLSKFQQMKYVYDTAREAALNQANNIEDANSMHFDFLVRTPIVILPKLVSGKVAEYDSVTINLGEIYAQNEFVLKDSNNFNMIKAGIRATKMFSDFHFEGTQQLSEIISGLDVTFDIDYSENFIAERPTTIINGSLDGPEIKLTEYQTSYLLHMAQSVSRVFSSDLDSDESLSELKEDATDSNAILAANNSYSSTGDNSPASATTDTTDSVIPDDHCKIDFSFDVSRLSMTIYNDTENITDFSEKAICRVSLHDLGVKFAMKQDDNFKGELHVKSFTLEDVRKIKDNKYTEIIPGSEHDSHQFMATLYSEGRDKNRYTYAMLSVDSPKTILALDFIFAVKTFADVAFREDDSIVMKTEPPALEAKSRKSVSRKVSAGAAVALQAHTTKEEEKSVSGSFGFTVNIVNSSVILLADPSALDSEAVVFKVEQLLITSQNIMSLSVSNVGMFLCRMNRFDDNRLRIIDDFSASLAIDSRGSNSTTFLTHIEASVDQLLMRLSLRDIRLAMAIFNRASALYNESIKGTQVASDDNEDGAYTFTKEFRKKLSQYAPTILSSVSSTSKISHKSSGKPVIVVKGEKLLAEIQGFRLVLIGDVHELPVLDMMVSPFSIEASNWSTDLEASTSIESHVNIFNYSTSTWEPLVEPWPISCHIARSSEKQSAIVVDVVSRQLAELTVTSRSIALMSQIFSLLADEEDLKPRDENTPYKILNQTGYDLNVWIDDNTEERANLKCIKNGAEIPWHFEDWRTVRETLSLDEESGLLGIEMVGSPYEIVKRISLKGEGEELFVLQPPIDKVHNRLSCEVKLNEDKIKTVVLRSTTTIENTTLVPLLVKIDRLNAEVFDDFRIEPGAKHALPIDAVYRNAFSLGPEMATSYKWSVNKVSWRDVLDGPVTIACPPVDDEETTEFFLQADAQYDKSEPLGKIYPHMNIVVSAPIEVENLLPFDISYRIYDKSYKKDWKNYLKKGSTSPIHVVRLEHLLLLSLQPLDCGYQKSEFAIINSPKGSEFKADKRLFLKHTNGQKLFLNLHYSKSHNRGAGVKVTIYTPYLVLNRTGEDLTLSENYNVMRSRAGATAIQEEDGTEVIRTNYPDMFSFDKPDRTNRAVLRVADSGASEPIGLDAIGQSFDLTLPVFSKQAEIDVGIHIAEGEGIYKLTKVITIAPRYIIRNSYSEAIQVREVGSSKDTVIETGASHPLYNLRRLKTKQFMFRFFGAESQWSSPFNITDIGQIHVKILKQGVGHVLLKVSILVENSTLFINVADAKNQWPFSIRNFSDEEIIFYQSDPNLDENGAEIKTNQPPLKPIYYRLPGKSVMPYSWDYPAGYIKELIIRSHGRERHIQLAEIGSLRPMRLPATENRASAIVDLSVVADGPTQSLVITNYDPSTSMYKLKSQQNSSTSFNQTENFETIETDENYYSKVIVRLEGLGISLIDHRLQELCYVTFRGVELRYNESDIYQNLSLKLKWIQIDNQLFGGFFPMILYPSVLPQSTKEMNNHPTFSGSISRVKDDTYGVQFVKFATILLQEMSVEIDEDFLFAVLDFAKIPGASWNKQVVNKLWDETLELPEPSYLDSAEDVYFESLHLQPMQMNLSFVRTDRISAEDRASSSNPLMFFLNVLTMAIGNINDAPVRLNALFIENVKVPIPVLDQMVRAHYGQAFLYQVHKILGSADFIGNPVGLFNNISSGFMDIFYEPYKGFIMNDRPQELGIGIAKGGLSFLKKSVFGFSDSFAKITGSMAKGLAVATLDKDFQERRLNQRRNKPKQPFNSFSSGASSFVDTISSGITGVATAPIEGSKQGAGGFFKGLGKGIVGFPTKTAIGFFDLANNVSEGIRNTTTAFDKGGLEKIRLPRFIGHDNIIRPFSDREAQGQYWLKVVDQGAFFNESYLAHVVLPGEENVVIVSFDHILLCSIITATTKWSIRYGDIKSISLENTGIKIGVKPTSGLRDGPFVPLGDSATRKFLYSRIGIAVQEYNKRCQIIL